MIRKSLANLESGEKLNLSSVRYGENISLEDNKSSNEPRNESSDSVSSQHSYGWSIQGSFSGSSSESSGSIGSSGFSLKDEDEEVEE